jgi:hypothetical protein
MMATGSRFLAGYVGRYRPSGVFATLEDRRASAVLALAFAASAPFQVLAFLAVFAFNGERAMVVVALLTLLADVVGLPILIFTGSLRAYALIGVWRLLITGIVGHYLLGGFLWSGGYLWFGMFAALIGALALRVSDTVALGAVTVIAGLAYSPFEGTLRQLREAPALGVSVFIIVSLGVVTTLYAGMLILLLRRRLQDEHQRNRQLMLTILPESVADRLKASPGMIADRFDGCTILFANLVGFTAHSKGKEPEQVVAELNAIFTRFDALSAQFGAEKIKTIGDGYMAACGLPDPNPEHVTHGCDLALAMLDAMPDLNTQLGTDFQLRVGVHRKRSRRRCRHIEVLLRRVGRHRQPRLPTGIPWTPGARHHLRRGCRRPRRVPHGGVGRREDPQRPRTHRDLPTYRPPTATVELTPASSASCRDADGIPFTGHAAMRTA